MRLKLETELSIDKDVYNAEIYLQLHYGNGVLGDAYLSAEQH